MASAQEDFEHRHISMTPLSDLRERMNKLLQSDPENWTEEDEQEWENLQTEVRRRREEDYVFDIGDEAILVGVEMTETNGAVGYMDDYNKNRYSVIVTGYNSEANLWEVMISEDTLRDLLSDSTVDDPTWREQFLVERPVNGGTTGYVSKGRYKGSISEVTKQGIYSPEE